MVIVFLPESTRLNDVMPRPQAKAPKALTPLLEIRNLTKSFDGQHAVDDVSLTIYKGEIFALLGASGCGKSTLLSLLKNEISADGGSMTYPGNWQLAWVNQETPALPQPAIDYVIDGDREYRQLEAALQQANERNDGHAIATVHSKLDAIDAWTIRSRAASLLHGLGFSNEQLERPVSDFSGGWRMRLNLAQALICRSDLLLLDEPTNHLDLDAGWIWSLGGQRAVA